MAIHTAPNSGSTFGSLTRGAGSGRESRLYIDKNLADGAYTDDTLSDETAAWLPIERYSNMSFTDGAGLNTVELNGSDYSTNISGYDAFTGSFTYTLRRGADPYLAYLQNAKVNKDIVRMLWLTGGIEDVGVTGWIAPVIFGEWAYTASGGDPISISIPFGLADCVDEAGLQEVKYDVTVAVAGTPAAI